MSEKSLAQGVLFYSSLYVNGILLITGMSTGRWVFMLLILLTMGLTAYLMYIMTSQADHLKRVGDWAEVTFSSHLEKLKRFL